VNKSPLRFRLPFLGKTKQSYLAAGVEDYQKRLGRFVHLSVPILREKRYGAKTPAARIQQEEGRMLLGQVETGWLTVALDGGGKQMSSKELLSQISAWEGQGRKGVCFLIGGAVGLSSEVLHQADLTLSLSKMTFTHEMARFILLEQVYRAFTIRAATGYHK
jgi:23S rRNA (pseudouridine1915-N3)-methyltransferase